MVSHTITLATKSKVAVKYLQAECGVRYWEDAEVNGVQDEDGSRIPLRDPKPNDSLGGGTWLPVIDLDTGIIENWPKGTTASVHYKVCDDGAYHLLDADRNVVASINGYVPSIMCPEGEGYGDYVIMEIDGDGRIAKWSVNLSEFEKQDED